MYTLPDLQIPAQYLLQLLPECSLVLLEGEMGAGKTTFVKEVCACMGCPDTVNSPTYALVNEYRNPAGRPLYHFDLYRLKNPSEAEDIGIYDYLDSGYPCLVEWPEMAGDILYAEPHIKIHFRVEDGKRILTFTRH